jgi:hypothetical protein
MSTAKLLAKLGPKVARIPMGEKRAAAGLPQTQRTVRKVRKAMELGTVGGVDPLTRVHGSQTQSMDYDAMTPQDIAAALGFIRDPLARELFCLTRWPGYAERDNRETRVLLLRRVMDEGQRRTDEHITAWLSEMLGGDCGRAVAERWPAKLDRYPRIVDLCMRHMDGSGLPEVRRIAKALAISEQVYRRRWRAVVEWVHDDFTQMMRRAEDQFRRAAEDKREP